MKKLLSVLLIIVLALFAVSCDESEKSSEQAEVEKTAKAFMDAYMELDGEEIKKHVVDPDDVPEFLDRELLLSSVTGLLPDEFGSVSNDFEDFMNTIIDTMTKDWSYTIKSTEKTDDGYTVSVETNVSNLDDVDFKGILENVFSDEDVLMSLIMGLYEAGKISDDMTESEMMEAMMPEIFKIATEAVKELEFEMEIKKTELVIVNSDGKWLVDSEKSFD